MTTPTDLDRLTQEIRALLPQGATAHHRSALERLAADAAPSLVGRDVELAALDAFLVGQQHYALLLAPSGMGKTALLLRWAMRVQQRRQWLVVYVPLGARYGMADAHAALPALAAALAACHGEHALVASYQQTPENLRPLVADYLRRPLPAGCRVVVVLDGLDQAIGWAMGGDMFSPRPDGALRVVCAAQPGAGAGSWLDALGWPEERAAHIGLAPLDRAAVQELVRCAGVRAELSGQIVRLSQGDPLAARLLSDALRRGLIQPDRLAGMQPGLDHILRGWLDSLGGASPASQALLALCAVARAPLSDADLRGIAPDVFSAGDSFGMAAEPISFLIAGDGSDGRGYTFQHARLRDGVCALLLSPQEQAALHGKLAAYGERWLASFCEEPEPPALPSYLRLCWGAHLHAAGPRSRVASALTQVAQVRGQVVQPWAAARLAAEGSYAGYLADLGVLWGEAAAHAEIVLAIRCALIAASISSLRARISSSLLIALVEVGTPEGRWSPAAARDHLQHIHDEDRQAKTIRAMVQHNLLDDIPALLSVALQMKNAQSRVVALIAIAARQPAEQAQPTWEAAFRAARQTINALARAEALTSIAPHLAPEQLRKALELAREIDESVYDHVLSASVSRMPQQQQAQFWEEAFDTALHIDEQRDRARRIAAINLHLTLAQRNIIIDLALSTAEEDIRAGLLKNMRTHLPSERVSSLLAMAETMVSEHHCADVLTELLPQLSKAEHIRAFTIVQKMQAQGTQERLLQAILPYLEGEHQMAAWLALLDHTLGQNREQVFASSLPAMGAMPTPFVVEAFEAARGISENTYRGRALENIIPHLPEELLGAALDAAQGIEDHAQRAKLLIALAPRMPVAEQAAIWGASLHSADQIETWSNREYILEKITPHLHKEQLGTLMRHVQQIEEKQQLFTNPSSKISLDIYLAAKHMPEALALVRTIPDERVRLEALKMICDHLDEQLADDALAIARTLKNTPQQIDIISKVIPHLPAHRRAERAALWDEVLAGIKAYPIFLLPTLQNSIVHLRSEHMPSVIQIIAQVWERWSIDAIFNGVNPYLLPEHLEPALDVAQKVESAGHRTRVLAWLSSHLPSEQQAKIQAQVLATARSMRNPEQRAISLSAIVPYLPTEQQAEVLREALPLVLSIEDVYHLEQTLASIAPRLSSELLDEALNNTQILAGEKRYAQMVKTLAPRLSAAQLDTVLDAATKLTQSQERLTVLSAALPFLREEQHAKALEVARSIEDNRNRASALQGLAPLLPAEQRESIIHEAIHITMSIQNSNHQMIAFLQISHLLSQPQRAEMLDLIDTTFDEDTGRLLRLAISNEHKNKPPAPPEPPIFQPRSDQGREALLQELSKCLPQLQAFTTPAELAAIARAIGEVAQCWP